MDIKKFYAQRFPKLDKLLREADMACGPDVWLLATQLLERLKQQDKLPKSEWELMPLLRPVFCRTPEEQARFPHLFEQCLNDKDKKRISIAAVNRLVSTEQGIFNALRTRVQKLDKYWWLVGIVLVIAFISVVVLYPSEKDSSLITDNRPPVINDNGTQTVAPDPASTKQPVPIIDHISPRTAPEPEPEPNDIPWLVVILLYTMPWIPITIYFSRNYFRKLKFSRSASTGEELFNQFHFDCNLIPVWGGAKAERALRDLRAVRFVPTRRLDIEGTVEATARSGGYFQPVYRNRREPPEHLMFVRSLDRHDQHAGLVQELAERFKTLGLKVHVYRFRDDPRILTPWDDEAGDSCRLEQVMARHGSARLMVISETDILFHPYSGETRPWLADLKPWPNKVWLHPLDAHLPHARLLASHHFLMLPLTRDSLPQMVSHLITEQPARLQEQPVDPESLPDIIANNFDAWLDEHPPQDIALSDMLQQLAHYLGSDGLCLLRTIAVYPKPNWELTKALDFLLYGHRGAVDSPEQREQHLFRLSRLPWLIHGFLPNWLREVLLQQSNPEERQRIVHAWQSLFTQLTDGDQPGSLQLDFSTPSKRRFKWRFDEQRMMRQSDALNDPIFAHILLDGKLGLLDFHLPQFLNKLMPQLDQWMILRPALLMWFCLALLGTGGIVQYGTETYTSFQQQRMAEQIAQWQVTLQYQQDTQPLAAALQQRLQQHQFQVKESIESTNSTSFINTITYAPGGEQAAKKIKHSLAWLTYGAQVNLDESAALDTESIQVQLVQTYQHGSTFNDELHSSLEARLPFEPEMVRIPPGKFLMGSPETEIGRWDTESPQHEVTIAYAFEISKFEVTFDEFDAFAKATNRASQIDEGWSRGKQPVSNVSFNDAQAYVQWLSKQTGKQYRLPSEAEWEYVARAGSQTRYWWGDDIGKNNAVCNDCGSQWNKQQTAPVGSFKANAFGLHDTAGNVWEWTQDCWHDNYNTAPTDGTAWMETEGGDCDRRVVRGGAWNEFPQGLRSANRIWIDSVDSIFSLGFRIARAL